MLDPGIFRQYDIRGVAGQSLTEDDAYLIGRAFASMAVTAQNRGICIGRDGRLSSPALARAAIQGMTKAGAEVVDIGLGPTPMLYFAAHTLKAAGGIMVTGSHNPPEHNGFKFVKAGKAFYGQHIQLLRDVALAKRFTKGEGRRKSRDVRPAYVKLLAGVCAGMRPLRVAWDAGNGAAGEVMSDLCASLPGEHVLLNAVIDGSFPAHHPDPAVPENLAQLIAAVRAQGLDAGIAFDGDADRIGAVDNEGEILWGDQLLMLFAADVLRARPGATIIADVKASDAVFEEIARLGGKPLMWKTGHSLIKAKMAQTHAALAGEMSGHMFFADRYFGYDDALYAAVRLLAWLSQSGRKLSELRRALPSRLSTPELRLACEDNRKFAVVDEVKTRLKAARADFSDVDGVRVDTADGWWLLRASNTQAILVARCEAMDEPGLARLKEALRAQLAQSGLAFPA